MSYRLESRLSAVWRWRRVWQRPHGESYPFDAHGLRFDTEAQAQQAADGLRRANAAEFRVVMGDE